MLITSNMENNRTFAQKLKEAKRTVRREKRLPMEKGKNKTE